MYGLRTALTVSLALASISACNPYDPQLGEKPFRCGMSEPACPDGFVCVQESAADSFCISTDVAGLPDGGDGTTDGGILECSGDDGLEPNDSIGDPTITPIPDFQDELELINLQICPMGDVDVYRFRIEQNGKNVKAEVMYSAAGGTLKLDILNEVGTSIKTGTEVGGNSNLLRAEVPNLPIGQYFVQVRGDTGVRNQYDVSIVVSGP
jgi:hypothetical protein